MESVAVRVEDETSVGRSYSAKLETQPGLGEQRMKLRSKSIAPGIEDRATRSLSGKYVHLSKASPAQILLYFRNSWALTEELFYGLRDDSIFFYMPDALRRRLIFYYGHTAAVYANKLTLAGLMKDVDLCTQRVFETGVDEMSWDLMDGGLQDPDFVWPTFPELLKFRNAVKAEVERIIASMPDPREEKGGLGWDSPYWALFMCFEHERIHIETSSVLIRQLPLSAVTPPERWKRRECPFRADKVEEAPRNDLVLVPETTAVLGKPRDFPQFGFDNEYGKRVVRVPSFAASRFLVSNAEFLPFVRAGGYRERKYWVSELGDDEGWRWVQYRNATHPSFWVATQDMPEYFGGTEELPYQKDDGSDLAGTGTEFKLRTEFHIVPMPWDWPVEVNVHESKAFLRWKAEQEGTGVRYRLPTEAEHKVMRADPSPHPESTIHTLPRPSASSPPHPGREEAVAEAASASKEDFGVPDWDSVEMKEHEGGVVGEGEAGGAGREDDEAATFDPLLQPTVPGNTNWRYLSPSPVHLFPPSRTGFHDASGNVWEWVEDHFAELPGFEIHPLYDDFSTPCFDGWHTMLLGGSWVSTGDQSSAFARYAFRRHFFQHVGFRYVALPPEAPPEPFPGAPTARNLWEGLGSLSRDVVDAYVPPSERIAKGAAALSLPAKALQYHSALAERVANACAHRASVLHLGCGVGAGSLELARHFERVVAVDKEEALVTFARLMQHHGEREFQRISEGVLATPKVVFAPKGVDRSRVTFLIGDAAALPPLVTEAAPFDAVVIDSLLTRLTQPLDLLRTLPALVKPGGTLVIASSHDWDSTHTPRNSWIGGFLMNGEALGTDEMLHMHLKKAFQPHPTLPTQDIVKLSTRHDRRFVVDLVQTIAFQRNAPTEAKPEDTPAASSSCCDGAASGGGCASESKE